MTRSPAPAPPLFRKSGKTDDKDNAIDRAGFGGGGRGVYEGGGAGGIVAVVVGSDGSPRVGEEEGRRSVRKYFGNQDGGWRGVYRKGDGVWSWFKFRVWWRLVDWSRR